MFDDRRNDLEAWLKRFVLALGHKTRGRLCPSYVAGLIGPGDRKSVQPMAARAEDASYDQLHHFVSSGVWDAAPLESVLLTEADAQVGGDDSWLIIDDSAAANDTADHWASLAQEGNTFGGGCSSIRFAVGQDVQLPDTGVDDTGAAGGAGHDRFAAFPARKLDQ